MTFYRQDCISPPRHGRDGDDFSISLREVISPYAFDVGADNPQESIYLIVLLCLLMIYAIPQS